MNEEITAFQFDELLGKFRCSSSDKTVEFIAHDLWQCYDDCKDHQVVASKQTWDYFNRILLLLLSEAEVEQVRNGVQWHFSQIFAGACFLVAVFLSARIGWKSNLLEVTGPFGLVSMAIAWFNQRRWNKGAAPVLHPFPSFSTLSIVRRRAAGFSKKVRPKALDRRRIRPPIMNWILWAQRVTFWLIFSPIVLFIQALPKVARETRLKLPDSGAAIQPVDQLG
jgi:hypothetical protein